MAAGSHRPGRTTPASWLTLSTSSASPRLRPRPPGSTKQDRFWVQSIFNLPFSCGDIWDKLWNFFWSRSSFSVKILMFALNVRPNCWKKTRPCSDDRIWRKSERGTFWYLCVNCVCWDKTRANSYWPKNLTWNGPGSVKRERLNAYLGLIC